VDDARQELEDFKEKEKMALDVFNKSQQVFNTNQTDLSKYTSKAKETEEKIGMQEEHVLDLKRQMKEHDKRVAEKEGKKEKAEKDLATMKENREKTGKEPPDLDKRLKDANARALELSKRVTGKHAELDSKKKELRAIENQKLGKQREIKEFRTVARAKEDALRHVDGGQAFNALKWLRENKDRFEKDVLGPVCLELSVKDRESACLIETALPQKKLLGFIAQTDKDYDTFIKEGGKQGHPLKPCFVNRMLQRETDMVFNEDFSRVGAGKLAEYGIEGSLKRRVDAPRPVMSWLCKENQFHRIATGSKATWASKAKLATDESLISTVGNGKKMHQFQRVFTPEGVINITFSMYGNKKQSVTDQEVKSNPRLVIHGDDSKLDDIKEELRNIEAQEQEVHSTLEALEREDQELRAQHTQAQERKKELEQEKARYNTKQLDMLIAQKEKEIEDLGKLIEKLKKSLPDIRKEYDNAHSHRMELAGKLKCFSDKITEVALKLMIATMEVKPLKDELKLRRDKVTSVKEVVSEKEEALRKENKLLQVLQRDLDKCKARKNEAQFKLSDAEKERIRPPDGDLSRLTDRPYDPQASEEENWETAEEWGDVLLKLRNEIEDMGVLSDHAERIQDIKDELEQLNIDIPQLEDETKNHGAKVAEYKSQWLDGAGQQMGLRHVIEVIHDYFSESFAKLGNVGQVKLDEAKDANGNDDFEKYGLLILVKFRENSELKPIGTFQSGGEGSLSTMLFMLSLQQLTVVPFRVVDEINQGMDANYERAVFQRICEESSKAQTSQCFLITPKLQVHGNPVEMT
jgi:chromosome segregation ATPase